MRPLRGEPRARVAGRNGLPATPDALLHLVRRRPQPITVTPAVPGVDDPALRRHQSYATIFVDLETHRPIDLIEGRDVDVVADWLEARPGARVVARDRSAACAIASDLADRLVGALGLARAALDALVLVDDRDFVN